MDNGRTISKMPQLMIRAVFIASLGGILFGYDMGVISGALPQVTSAFDLTNTQEEMVVSFLYVGGIIGAAVGGTLCDFSGRKTAILVTDVIFIIGSFILFYSGSYEIVLVGRVVVGFAVAVSGVADVSYLHEISPPEWRGSIVSINEACISLGFLVSFIVGYGVTQLDPDDGWRIMFGLSSIVALFQFVGMLFMPESPIWLTEKGRCLEAESALKFMYGQAETTSDQKISSSPMNISGDVRQEVLSGENEPSSNINRDSLQKYDTIPINSDEKREIPAVPINSDEKREIPAVPINPDEKREIPDGENSSCNSLPNSNYFKTVTEASLCGLCSSQVSLCKRQIIIALFLTSMQQFCGHTNIINFAPMIFNQLGFESNSTTLIVTMVLGVFKFVITCCVIWKIEQIGRRPLLLFGVSTITVSMLMLFIGYESIDENGDMNLLGKTMAIIGVFGVIMGYGGSFGPLSWLLVSEIFPSNIRGRALGASTICSYLSAVLVSYTLLSWQNTMGTSIPFVIYSVLTAAFLGFAYLAIPETGGKDFDQIIEELDKMSFWHMCRRKQVVLSPIAGATIV